MEEEKVSQEILDRNRTANEIIELMQKEVDEYDGPIMLLRSGGPIPLYEIAEAIVRSEKVKFYKENFYLYKDGVYIKDTTGMLDKKIFLLNKEFSKSERNEIKEYIKLIADVTEVQNVDYYINFKNCILNVETLEKIEHDSEMFFLNQINANYNEQIDRNEYIDKFLNDVTSNNEKRKQAILQIIGYCMTTSLDFQKAFVFYGPTAENGKSVLVDVIGHLIGEDNTSHISIHELQNGRFYAAELTNKLLNIVAELPRNHLKSVEVFKSIVTGDAMSVEEKYKNRYSIKPYAKNIFTANELPRVDDNSEGYFRRLNICKFEAKFTEEEKRNFNKRKLLTQEALDYLAFISVKAYNELLNSNSMYFANEDESNEIVEKYRQENNSALSFISSEYIKNKLSNGESIDRPEIYSIYKNWCSENGYKAKGRNKFYAEIESQNLLEMKYDNGYPKYRRNTDMW